MMQIKRFMLLLVSCLLVFWHQTLETNANECIDMDVHAREVVSCCRYETFCSQEADEKCSRETSLHVELNSPNFTVCFIDCAYREMGYITENNKLDVQ
uniref:Uncharacterized protein n=1 Tax=Anopheles minimus TaxID=112268 RepID=A0A182WHR2_9DIPT